MLATVHGDDVSALEGTGGHAGGKTFGADDGAGICSTTLAI